MNLKYSQPVFEKPAKIRRSLISSCLLVRCDLFVEETSSVPPHIEEAVLLSAVLQRVVLQR